MLKLPSTRIRFPNRQRGAALLILLTLIVLAASYTLLKKLNREQPDIVTASSNTRILGEARAALMGYALKSTTRPGELPCPDNDNDGDSNTAVGGDCANYIGRLPWRTLGLADLRDESGERLWYVLDAAFDTASPNPINSDTTASLILDGGATPYAALVFAPGGALQGQARPQAVLENVNRYLEDDNNNGDLNYVSTAPNDFNDQVEGIKADVFMQAVERRVLTELKRLLEAYYGINKYYPHPAALNGTSCDSSIPSGQGQLPQTINASCPSEADWPAAPPAAVPAAWLFGADAWNSLIWYAPALACTQPSLPDCSGPGGLVQVGSPPADKHAILIAAGRRLAGQNRPTGNIADLLEDVENTNGDMNFVSLPIDVNNNDKIEIVAP